MTFSPFQDCTQKYIVKNYFYYYLFKFSAALGEEIFYITFLPFTYWNIDHSVSRRMIIVWSVSISVINLNFNSVSLANEYLRTRITLQTKEAPTLFVCSSCLGRKGIAIMREEVRGIIWLRVSSSLLHLGLFFQHNHCLSCFWCSLHRAVGKTLPSQCVIVFQGLFFITSGNLSLILIYSLQFHIVLVWLKLL